MFKIISTALFSLLLVSCSGGGSSSSASSSQGFTISGTIQLPASFTTDSDNNDPLTSVNDNSTRADAQSIQNVVTLNGFVTAEPTFDSNENNFTDNFAFSIDENDYYRVSLQANQQVTLTLFDAEVDIDLYLRNMNATFADIDNGSGLRREVVAPVDGDYFIQVAATNGSAKYVLELKSVSASTGLGSRVFNIEDIVPGEAIVKFKNTVTSRAEASLVTSSAFVTSHQKNNSPAVVKFSHTKANRYYLSSTVEPLSQMELELQQSDPTMFEKLQTLKNIEQLNESNAVEYAEPNFYRKSLLVPNDTFYPYQWHYEAINLPLAWNITTGMPSSGNVVVAVIDTGVYMNHVDLDDLLFDGYDFISNTNLSLDGDGIDSDPDDPGDQSGLNNQNSWHGTHVAGTVASESNNNQGVAGVSWSARIMPLRVLGRGGIGSTSDLIEAMKYAAGLPNASGTLPLQRADIINLSLGSANFSAAEEAVINQITALGIIVVAAAGNDNSSEPFYPASYDDVISVSALNSNNTKAYYSNFGADIDLAAPGGDFSLDSNSDGEPDGIFSTYVIEDGNNRSSGIGMLQGTSMASPHVAGVLALMKAIYPSLDANEVNTLLLSGNLTNDIGSTGRDDLYGYGVIDAFDAVSAAYNRSIGGPLPAAIASAPSTVNFGATSTIEVDLENFGDVVPVLDSITIESDWLTVQTVPGEVGSDSMGTYQFSVDRTGLVDGAYTNQVIFNFTNTSDLVINISMTVGNLPQASNSSQLYALLFDVSQTTVLVDLPVFQQVTVNPNTLSFTFTDVPAGEYQIVIGDDIDNNNEICAPGDLCGYLPEQTSFQSFLVGQNETNLIVVPEIAGLVNSVSSTGQFQERIDAPNYSIQGYEISKKAPETTFLEKRVGQ